MDFVREVWYVLQNVPAVAHRYQAHALWAAVTLVLSVASFALKSRLLGVGPKRRKVLKWVSAASAAVTAAVFVLAFVDLVRHRLPFDDLVCTDVAVDGYYRVPQDMAYELVERYRCSNRTGASIRNFAPLQDGYFEQVPAWKVEYTLIGRPAVQLVVHRSPGPEARKNTFPGGGATLYVYRASAEFEPALPPGESIDLVYRLSARGAPVEAAAFSHAGTVFARGVEYDTLSYHVTIHAPSGYEIRLRDWGVLDAGGRLVDAETRRQDAPRVSPAGGLLQWRVSLARRHLRYMLRYSLEAYGLR
ncbi:MAG TPA: hypothetical protein VFX28_19385 [Methylomirabilota bacterium]|nr:hypothetical protein [Methylomirabilota bacterium]